MSEDSSRRRLVVGGVLAVVVVALVMVLAAPARTSTTGAKVDDTAAIEPGSTDATPGSLVGAPEAPAAENARPGGVAPIAEKEGGEDPDLPPYSSESVAVASSSDRRSAATSEAAAQLDRATRGVHDCERTAQERHEKLGRPGRADPLLCVYDHTAMRKEKGAVRMDVVTPTGYSYYVDADDGTRYRYSEYDGVACHSIDGVDGCSAW